MPSMLAIVLIISASSLFAWMPNDARKSFIQEYMEQNTSSIFVGSIHCDRDGDGIGESNCSNTAIRIVGWNNGRLWIVRGKTDKHGNFRIKIPANKPFRFGAYCSFCGKPGFVWYAKENPGVQPNIIYEGKW